MLTEQDWRAILKDCQVHSRVRCLLAVDMLSPTCEASDCMKRICGAQVASKDIAGMMAVSRPSVHVLLDALQKDGLIFKEHYGRVSITPSGRKKAGYLKNHLCAMTETIIDRLGTSMLESAALALECINMMDEARLSEIENVSNEVNCGINEERKAITC